MGNATINVPIGDRKSANLRMITALRPILIKTLCPVLGTPFPNLDLVMILPMFIRPDRAKNPDARGVGIGAGNRLLGTLGREAALRTLKGPLTPVLMRKQPPRLKRKRNLIAGPPETKAETRKSRTKPSVTVASTHKVDRLTHNVKTIPPPPKKIILLLTLLSIWEPTIAVC